MNDAAASGEVQPRQAKSGMRLRGLIRKEFLQIFRDPSSIAIAFLMPLMLLLLFGYGVSLDSETYPWRWSWSNRARTPPASPAASTDPAISCPPRSPTTRDAEAGDDGRPRQRDRRPAPGLRAATAQPDGAPDPVDRQRRGRQHRHGSSRAMWRASGANGWSISALARGETLGDAGADRAARLVQQRIAQPQFPGARPDRRSS